MTQGIFTYKDTENYTAKLEREGDKLFLHCEVHVWSKDVLKELRFQFLVLTSALRELGWEWLFTYTRMEEAEKAEKFWGMIHPLTDKEKFEIGSQEYLLGAWDLEEA